MEARGIPIGNFSCKYNGHIVNVVLYALLPGKGPEFFHDILFEVVDIELAEFTSYSLV